jgi:predicted CoA-binding protein
MPLYLLNQGFYMSKKTLVMGASSNPERYSYLAVNRLVGKGHEVVAIGKQGDEVAGVPIDREPKEYDGVDTVTLYLNPRNQKEYYDFISELKPNRVIFNPGAENLEFEKLLQSKGIKTQEACTLVLLSTGQY